MNRSIFRAALSSILLASILFSSAVITFPRQAYAVPATTSGGEAAEELVGVPVSITPKSDVRGGADNSFWTILGKAAARALLQELTKSIIVWMQAGIRDGFQFGKPYFVQNPGAFLLGAADLAIGHTLDTMLGQNAQLLCSPFRLNIFLGLMSFQFDRPPSCTLSQIISNVDSLYSSFSTGAWGNFLSISTGVDNNAFASLLVTWDGLARAVANSSDHEQASWSINSGLLFTRCKTWHQNFYGEQTCTEREQTTPGGMVMDNLMGPQRAEWAWLGMENNINAIAGAAISALITYQLMPKLQDGLLGTSDAADRVPGSYAPATIIADGLTKAADRITSHEGDYQSPKNASLAAVTASIANLTSLQQCASENHAAEITDLTKTQTTINGTISESQGYVTSAEGYKSQAQAAANAGNTSALTDLGNQLADLTTQSDTHDIGAAQSEKETLQTSAGTIRTNLTVKCPGTTPQ